MADVMYTDDFEKYRQEDKELKDFFAGVNMMDQNKLMTSAISRSLFCRDNLQE